MSKPLVAANWKMNMISEEAEIFFSKLCELMKGNERSCDVLICPPFTIISRAKELACEGIMIGAQNMHWEEKGAFTGEISPLMLVDAGAHFVILGHSERRTLFNESSKNVSQKVEAALRHGLTPVICVGEEIDVRNSGRHLDYVREQLIESLPENSALKELAGEGEVVFAYEPLWAIGTGNNATPEQAQEMHMHIKKVLSKEFPFLEKTRVIYGGSVKPGNAKELISMPDVEGFLVGGASLDPESFFSIISSTKK